MRLPRKSKKWHLKHGWTIKFTPDGKVYFVREGPKFRVGGRK